MPDNRRPGGFALLTGFVQTPTQLLIIRFVLGVAEGAVYPAILALIGHWFPNEERAGAIAYFQMNGRRFYYYRAAFRLAY